MRSEAMTWRKLWLYPYRAFITLGGLAVLAFCPVALYDYYVNDIYFLATPLILSWVAITAFICWLLLTKDKKKWVRDIWC